MKRGERKREGRWEKRHGGQIMVERNAEKCFCKGDKSTQKMQSVRQSCLCRELPDFWSFGLAEDHWRNEEQTATIPQKTPSKISTPSICSTHNADSTTKTLQQTLTLHTDHTDALVHYTHTERLSPSYHHTVHSVRDRPKKCKAMFMWNNATHKHSPVMYTKPADLKCRPWTATELQ